MACCAFHPHAGPCVGDAPPRKPRKRPKMRSTLHRLPPPPPWPTRDDLRARLIAHGIPPVTADLYATLSPGRPDLRDRVRSILGDV